MNRGSALLEMILFTPLAMLFLFIVVDGGLSLLERAAISDSIRSGLNTESLHNKSGNVLYLDQSYSLQIAEDETLRLLSAIASQISENITTTRLFDWNKQSLNMAVIVAGVVVDIDASSGQNSMTYDSIGPVSISLGSLQSNATIHSLQKVSREEFIERQLRDSRNSTPSAFALPIGINYGDRGETNLEINYFQKSVLIYAEALVLTRGLNPTYAETILGSFYGFQDQYLFLLRTQLS
jgi:hypothetical protein